MAKTLFSSAGRELAQLLAGARSRAGMTQAQLAKKLGRPQPVISLIERGERRVDVIEFCDIADALDIDPAELFARFLAARARSDEG